MCVQSVCHNVTIFGKYYNEFENIKDAKFTIEDVDERLKKRGQALPCVTEDDDKWHSENKAMSINGYWYDVTNFIPHHPGGRIIEKFLRCDATSSFYAMHGFPEKILKKRWPIARHFTNDPKLKKRMEEDQVYWRLHQRYTELGVFERSKLWLAKVICLN